MKQERFAFASNNKALNRDVNKVAFWRVIPKMYWKKQQKHHVPLKMEQTKTQWRREAVVKWSIFQTN